jgi:hypothetical protein
VIPTLPFRPAWVGAMIPTSPVAADHTVGVVPAVVVQGAFHRPWAVDSSPRPAVAADAVVGAASVVLFVDTVVLPLFPHVKHSIP